MNDCVAVMISYGFFKRFGINDTSENSIQRDTEAHSVIRLSVVMKRPGLLAIALALVVGVQSVRSEGARLSRTQQNPRALT